MDVPPWHHGPPPEGGFPSFYRAAQGHSAGIDGLEKQPKSTIPNIKGYGTTDEKSGSEIDENEHVSFDLWDDNGPRLNLNSAEAGMFLWGGAAGMKRLTESGVYDRKVSRPPPRAVSQVDSRYARSGTFTSTICTSQPSQGAEDMRIQTGDSGDDPFVGRESRFFQGQLNLNGGTHQSFGIGVPGVAAPWPR